MADFAKSVYYISNCLEAFKSTEGNYAYKVSARHFTAYR